MTPTARKQRGKKVSFKLEDLSYQRQAYTTAAEIVPDDIFQS